MRASRVVIAATSAVGWPFSLLVVAAGITFTAARVYAEAAMPPISCEHESVTSCEGMPEWQACACPFAACACASSLCAEDAGDSGDPFPPTRGAKTCQQIMTCEDSRFTSCEGKSVGASCDSPAPGPQPFGGPVPGKPGVGKCVQRARACFAPDGGGYSIVDRLDCEEIDEREIGSDAGSSTDASPSGAPTNTPSSSGGNGCATSSAQSHDAIALAGAPFALALVAWRLRRRRQPTNAPSARKRS